jgi:type I restriction enzyme S subunit
LDAPSRARQKITKSDILFSTVRTYLKNIAMVPEQLTGQIASTGFSVLRPQSGIEAKYLFLITLTSMFLEPLNKLQHGSSYPAVRDSDVREQIVPVAPTNEQHRIVTKIEELFSHLDQGVANLKQAREQLKVYRQSLLKAAFEGRLTAQWRQENAAKLETSAQLLARIKKEREARYQQQLDAWNEARAAWEKNGKSGKQPTKPAKPKEIPPLTKADLSELPLLPAGWGWVRPEEVASTEEYSIGIGPFGSNLKVSDYTDSGVPLIFVRNITKNNFTSNLKYISEYKFAELKAHTVQPLDIVITKMGDPPGDCEIYPENRPIAVLTADCLKFRIDQNYADRRYFKYCIRSQLIKKQLGLITKGVAQKKISVERFKTVKFPYPSSLAEQQLIANKLEQKMSIIETLDHAITQSLQQAEILRQAILKKAFAGQLVPQDPHDEPAALLLERIRAERRIAGESPRTVRRRPPKNIATTKETPMPNLIDVLKDAADWLPAQEVFRRCGIADGAETEAIERLYAELRDYLNADKIQVERRQDKERNEQVDYLRVTAEKRP